MCPSAVSACRTRDRVWVQQMKPPDIWWSLSKHCTPLPKLRATRTSGKRKLPALCVSLQPVIKQLGWFSNMPVIKYLFYSDYFFLMKRPGHCSVGQVEARVSFPFLPHPNCCHRAPPPLLQPHPEYPHPQRQSALSSLPASSVPRQRPQEETRDKGGHVVTVEVSPFPRALAQAHLERVQDSAVVVDHDGVSLLPFQPRGTLQAGMDPD